MKGSTRFFLWFPEEYEVILLLTILLPVVFHIYDFCSILLEHSLDETIYCSIVYLDRGRRLLMIHLDKCSAHDCCILSISNCSSYFDLVAEATISFKILHRV